MESPPRRRLRTRRSTGQALAAACVAGLGLALALGAGAAAAARPDVIRVGGPSAAGDAKVAVVATGGPLGSRGFRVLDRSGREVLRGRLVRAPGSPRPWRHAYLADLSAIREPGRYTVRVGALRSEPWVVTRTGSRTAIPVLLRFFAANADGAEPSPLHGPSHLNDATVESGPLAGQRVDLTGGWMDAGDTLKFTHTIAFASYVLELAARLDPADAAALHATSDVGIRWLLKAHPAPDVFIAQVGDERDHQRGFARPQLDDASGLEGIARRTAYPAISGDLGGRAAAALALAALRADEGARAGLVAQAREWYAAGRASARAAPTLPGDFYPGTTWEDEMAAGAVALWRATGEPGFLADAVVYLEAADAEAGVDWDGVASLAAADLCGVTGAPAPDDAAARDLACRKLAAAAGSALGQAATNAFGTPGAFVWGQTGLNGGGGAAAALAARAGVLPEGAVLAAAARDWLLGRNPWGASFVVGYGRRPARDPHHWARVIRRGEPVGAVVGGPAARSLIAEQGLKTPRGVFDSAAATYEDRAADYVTSEPALWYTAVSVLLLAALAPAG